MVSAWAWKEVTMIEWVSLALAVNGWIGEGWGYSVPTPHMCAQLPSSVDQQLFRVAGSDSVTCSSVLVMQGIPRACVQL